MDGLGATASVIAVLQLASVVVKYLNGVRNASSEIGRLLLEVSAVRGTSLADIRCVGDEAKESWISF